LVQLPGLFTTLPQHSPSLLLGSNKFTSMFGTATAAWRYARRVVIPWRPVLLAAATAFLCSFLGATTVSLLPREAVRPLVLVLLVAILAYTLLKKDFGALPRPQQVGRRELAIAIALGGAIGFYDGFFGPGTGTLLILLFTWLLGMDMVSASATAKPVNLASNISSLITRITAGNVLFALALPAMCCSLAGGWLGAKLALTQGARLIRIVMLCVLVLLTVRLAVEWLG
jgi:uncharacterized membrane protein YfcA